MENLIGLVSHEAHFQECWFIGHSWDLHIGTKSGTTEKGGNHLRSLSHEHTGCSKMSNRNCWVLLHLFPDPVKMNKGKQGRRTAILWNNLPPVYLIVSMTWSLTHQNRQMCSYPAKFKVRDKNNNKNLSFTFSKEVSAGDFRNSKS